MLGDNNWWRVQEFESDDQMISKKFFCLPLDNFVYQARFLTNWTEKIMILILSYKLLFQFITSDKEQHDTQQHFYL